LGQVTERVDLSSEVLNTQVGFRKSLDFELSVPVAAAAPESFVR